MKKFLLTCLLTLSSAVAFAFSGSGTEADPYLIKTADDLYMIRMTPDAYYQLQNNIDLSAWIEENYPTAGWVPIGTSPKPFTGTFDGNGFTISNLHINRASDYNGLFGYAKNATVKNLIIKCNITGGGSTGAIIGNCASVSLSNCKVEGDVQGAGRTGGFIGDGSTGTYDIKDCTFTGNVNGGQYTGGFVGYAATMTVTNCSVKGDVNGEQYTGGICGCGTKLVVTNSSLSGQIEGEEYSGGISGNGGALTVKDCEIRYDIKGTDYCGGFCGYANPFDATKCIFLGKVEGEKYTGGLGGCCAKLQLSYCAVEGSINGNGYVGGLAGQVEQSTIKISKTLKYLTVINQCYVKGNIYSKSSYVGGLVGYDNSCYVLQFSQGGSTIYDTDFSYRASSKIDDCYFDGNIQAKGDYAGGICGYATGEYSKCYATGEVTGTNHIGGIVGFLCGQRSYHASLKEHYTTVYARINSCVSLCSKIQSKEGAAIRIGESGEYSDFGALGTRNENKALSNCKIYDGEELQSVEDSPENGYETIPSVMRHAITYTSIGWDFTDVWDIDEGNGYPFLRFRQPAPSVEESMILTDVAPVILAGSYEPGKVKYQRVASGDYASFCLPFDVDLSAAEGIEMVYMPMEQILYNTETQYLMMFLQEQDMTSTVKAGTPFLAKIADADVSFSNAKRVAYGEPLSVNPAAKALTVFDFDGKSGVLYENNSLNVLWGGTYVATEATTGLNSFNINGSFGQHTGTLSPYRAYVMQTVKSGAASNVRGIQLNLGDDEGEVTSVFQLLNNPAATESIYDMQGRRVFSAQQGGLYIINGKKVRL